MTWPFVVRKALLQTSVEEALNCILDAELAGGHNYLVFDRQGHGFDIEAMPDRRHVIPWDDEVLVHTNHCLAAETRPFQADRPADLQASSEARLGRATDLLKSRPVTIELLQELTRDADAICRRPEPPYFAATCGAVIMRPATSEVWAVWGLPSEHEYEHYTVT